MRQKGFTPVLIIIVLALIGIVVAYYFGMQKVDIQNPTETVVSKATNIPIQNTPDPTTNWKTYISNEMKFSLKHPLGYSEEEINDLGPNDKRVIFKSSTNKITSFTVSTSPAKLPDYPFDQKPTGNYSLDGYQGLYVELPNGYPDGGDAAPSPSLAIYIQNGNKLYQITFYGVSSISDPLVAQILSTFKFIK